MPTAQANEDNNPRVPQEVLDMILKLCPKAVLRTVLFTSKVVSNVALPHFCASMAFTAREGANFSFVEGHAQASPKTPPRVALLASFVQELHLRGRPGQVAKLDLCTLRGILKAYPRVHRLRLSDLIWWGTECQRAGVLVRMGGSLWIETVDGLELAQEEDRVEVVEEPIDVEAEDGRGEGPTTWVTNGEDYVLSEGPTPSLEHLGLHEHNEPLPPRLTSMTLTRVISATAAHDRLGLLDLLGPEPIVALKYDVLKLYAATRARGSSSQESSYSAVAACSANQIVEVAEEIKRLPSATGATSLELIELSDLTARHLVPVLVAAGPTVKHLHLAMSRRSHASAAAMSKLKLDLCPALTTVTFTCSLGSVRLNHCIEASLEALASWWACLPATVQLVRIFVDIGRRTLGGRFGPGGAVPIRALPWATLHKRFAALRKSAPSKTLDIRVIALRGDVEAYTWATDGIAQAHSDWAQGCEEFDRRMEAKAPSFISFVPSAGATFRCGREKADMS